MYCLFMHWNILKRPMYLGISFHTQLEQVLSWPPGKQKLMSGNDYAYFHQIIIQDYMLVEHEIIISFF